MKRLPIRSAMTDYEAERLSHYARGCQVTECGSLLGFSTVVMARVARHVVSVDRHDGYRGLGIPNDTQRAFRNNLDRFNVANKVTVVVSDYARAREYGTPDLAFIDLDGTLATTLAAVRLLPAPMVALHDYGRFACGGVAQAVEILRAKHQWRVIERAHTLIVMERKP